MPKAILLGASALIALLLVCGFVFERFCEWRDVRRYPPPGKMVDVGGHQLHIRCEGDAPGPTIVIEQGAASPSMLWWPITAELAKYARVCTYDRSGYLWSPWLGRPRSILERTEDLHAVLKRAGVPGPYVFAPLSYGGLIISQYVRRYPDEVAGIAFIDAPDEPVVFNKGYLKSVGGIRAVFGTFGLAARFGILRLRNFMFGDPIAGLSPKDMTALKALTARPSLYATIADDFGSIPAAPEEIRIPLPPGSLGDKPIIALTHGIPFPPAYAALENGWREGQERLVKLSSNSRLVVAEKSNHMIPLEQPDAVVDAISRVYRAAADRGPLN